VGGAFVNLWHINEDKFEPDIKKIQSQETVFTIGNGYFCTRGTFEEGYPRDNAATLLYGVFDSIPIAREELANVPDWIPIKLFVNGERFRLDRGKLLDYSRRLDMQYGVISRSVRWESPGGIRIHVQSERFASLADEHTGAIRYSVTLEDAGQDQECDIAVWSTFNLAEGNYDVMHWENIDQGHEGDVLWYHCETKKTLVQLAQTMSFTSHSQHFKKTIIDSDIAPGIRYTGTLTTGETFTADKIVMMYTSRDTSDPVASALECHQQLLTDADLNYRQSGGDNALSLESEANTSTAAAHAYGILMAQQKKAWQQAWQIMDVVIEGDEKAQLGVRYNLYQLRINVSTHDSRYSIAAKGLTGFGYRGHVFHDTEIFMLPFFTYVMPEIARNLLLYRYHLLPAARKKAASNGYEGAQYPWESTLDGEETTPGSIIHPETGEVIPVLNGFIELHITASIAHAVWEYWRITGDDSFMLEYGAELLLSTAMFWGSRAEKNEATGDYEINDVIGPDEWHEHVNNNIYTNYMARKNIQYALSILEWLRTNDEAKAQELIQQLNLNNERLTHWQDIADHLRIVQDPQTKVFEQFEGFFNLEPLDQKKYRGRKDSYQGILGVHATQKYRIIKQADALMLLTVANQDFDYETKKANWDYYYPITDHDYGSSLTPALHVILACELDQADAAYELFLKGALVDLENLRGNTPEGIHTACAGAVWQAAILGFAGLRVIDDSYKTDAHWPAGWTRLAFKFFLKGKPISVDLRK
jgi:trehalose/maltose hydrolase-like predicted phosphorylase